jgi:alpha-beta hydrolase superfamily lysophospholipase
MSKARTDSAWLPEVLTSLAVASGVGYVAAAYTVSRWLTRPTPGRSRTTPSDHGLPWEALECRTADGFRLVGWAVSPPRPLATVVLFHGIRGNRARTLERMTFLVQAGYRCVAFDHRAHGESSGRKTSFGYHEGRDVEAVLGLVRARWPIQPCAALGISMGAAALCFAADAVRSCAAVVLESMYHDVGSTFVNRIGNGYPPWFRRFSRGVVWITERRLGVRLDQLAPVQHIAGLAPAPVLVLTGAEDSHATPDDAVRLYEKCREPRELWLVPRAGHKDVCETGGDLYRERILDFLERHATSSPLAA